MTKRLLTALADLRRIVNKGHAHLDIDGEKITRLYGNWYYLEAIAPGSHEMMVSLTANGHELLMQSGEPIADTETLEVAADDRLEDER